MSIFDVFKKKRKVRAKKSHKNSQATRTNLDLRRILSNIEYLQSNIKTINVILQRHDEDITEQSIIFEKHCEKVKKLEELLAKPQIAASRTDPAAIGRPDQADRLTLSSGTIGQPEFHKFDIAHFTDQEKKILCVFFQNRQTALSYADIAGNLNRSANTVKNHMRQIRMKADLFDCQIGDENRKRFQLKEGLKIEKYLNVSQTPTNHPLQTA